MIIKERTVEELFGGMQERGRVVVLLLIFMTTTAQRSGVAREGGRKDQ